jgi:peptidoglycan/xylan/chitin deacetylase (PgdA/CDA1 family)
MRAISAIIIIVIGYATLTNGKHSIINSLESGNLELIKEAAHKCVPVEQEDAGKTIILRMDDVQAFAYADISKMIIDDVIKRQMKITLGVIPKNFSKDIIMSKYLEKNICNLELALHGWDHSYSAEEGVYEFEMIDAQDAKAKLEAGKEILEKISGKNTMTFIPPGNKISPELKKLLELEGIKYISGEYESGIYGMDATTFDFVEYKLVENELVLKNCDERFKKNMFCVVVLHPQDYLTDDKIDMEKYGQFLDLLDEFKKRGARALTFSDL